MLTVSSSLTASLDPQFAHAVEWLIAYANWYGYEARIISGYRSLQEQERLYARGRTPEEIRQRVRKQGRGGAVTDAPPGSSAHNYGLAVDIAGRDQSKIIALGRWLGFGTVSWDPAHLEWPSWQRHVGG